LLTVLLTPWQASKRKSLGHFIPARSRQSVYIFIQTFTMATEAKSIEELFPLIEFCKAGNLAAVSKWIS
jgi:hypothetical protein